MKKKNGFVFVETMIVIVTVVTSLLLIYSSYVSLRSLERKRVRYDDPAYIYKTYAIGKFLTSVKDENGSSVIRGVLSELRNDNEKLIKYVNPKDNVWYSNEEDNICTCSDSDPYCVSPNCKEQLFSYLYSQYHVLNMIIISKDDMNLLADPNENYCRNCNSSSTNDCEKRCSKIPNNFYDYIKSIDTSDDTGNPYYLIVEYAEKIDGKECDPNDLINNGASTGKFESSCTYYFSNIKIGGNYD